MKEIYLDINSAIPWSYGSYWFIYKFYRQRYSYESCKELFCHYITTYNSPFYFYCKHTDKLIEKFQQYEALLGLPETSISKVKFIGSGNTALCVEISGFLYQNVVAREVAAILLKVISSKINSPVSLETLFTHQYFRGRRLKLSFENLRAFLDGVTKNELERCDYVFNNRSRNNHGGLLNWSAARVFDSRLKQLDKQKVLE